MSLHAFTFIFFSYVTMRGKKTEHHFIPFPFEMRFYLLHFFYSKLVNKEPLAKTLNYSFCKRLLNLAVFKCSGRSVSDFSRRSLNHKGLEWVIQMARVLMAIFFKGDLFSLLAFLPFLSIFFIVFLPCERDTVSYFTRSNY